MDKKFDLNGSAPARSKIKLIGPAGHNIGETEADAAGNWRVFGVEFGPGDHVVHARVRTPGGSLVCSENVAIHVDTPEELAEQAEQRRRALDLYEQTAEAFAAGYGIEAYTVREVCDLAGVSIEQFTADVQLIRELEEEDARIAARS